MCCYLLGLPPLEVLETEEKRVLVSGLDSCLSSSEYNYNREGSIGIITPNRQVSTWLHTYRIQWSSPYVKLNKFYYLDRLGVELWNNWISSIILYKTFKENCYKPQKFFLYKLFFPLIIFWASLFLLFCVSCFRATFGHSSDWIVASLLKIRRKLWPQLIVQFRGIAYRINHWETYHFFSKLPCIKHACRIVSLFHVTHLWSEPVLRMSQKHLSSVGKPSISSRWVLLQWRKAYNGGLNTTSSSSLPTRALILMSAFVFLFLFWSFCAEQRYCISTCVILELAWLVFYLSKSKNNNDD